MVASALQEVSVSFLHELVHEFGVLEHHDGRLSSLQIGFFWCEQGGLRPHRTSLIGLEVKA